MGEQESHQAASESRRDVTTRPTAHRHADALRRFLGAAAYQQTKPAEAKEPDEPRTESTDDTAKNDATNDATDDATDD